MIDVILMERVERLGQLGDVVRVRPGFARNYLLPRKKALRATPANLEFFKGKKAEIEATNLAAKKDAEKVAAKVDGSKLVVIRQAGEAGQLFGSVTARDIAADLKTAGTTVDKSQVQIDTPIKSLGLYKVKVRLHPEVAVTISVNVARSQEEAEVQEKTGHAIVKKEEAAAAETAPEPTNETAA
ncbi:MAG: 50S ribosomal protein L9 [Bdellovibrionales bacterium]